MSALRTALETAALTFQGEVLCSRQKIGAPFWSGNVRGRRLAHRLRLGKVPISPKRTKSGGAAAVEIDIGCTMQVSDSDGECRGKVDGHRGVRTRCRTNQADTSNTAPGDVFDVSESDIEAAQGIPMVVRNTSSELVLVEDVLD